MDERTIVQLGDLTLTGVDSAGMDWHTLTPISGWAGSPASTLTLTQKPRSPGGWLSPRQLTPRTISLNGLVVAPDPSFLAMTPDAKPATFLATAADQLNSAASLDATTLTVTEGDTTRFCTVYRQDEVLFEAQTDMVAQWSIQLSAADPRKFATPLTGLTGLPASTGGFTIPFTVPFSIASTVVSGNCALTNPGNTAGPVRLRIDGPIVGPVVTHVSTGLALVFASSLTLGSGEWLEVDMDNQSVLANGQSSRNGWVTSRGWSAFDPGPNVWAFSAVSGSGQLTVSAQPAWQ